MLGLKLNHVSKSGHWPNLFVLNLRNNHLSFVTEPFNYGRVFVTLDQHNLSCSSHLNWMRQCRTTKHHPNESRTRCGNHEETVLVDVSFSCPGTQGWMKSNYSKFHTDPLNILYVKKYQNYENRAITQVLFWACISNHVRIKLWDVITNSKIHIAIGAWISSYLPSKTIVVFLFTKPWSQIIYVSERALHVQPTNISYEGIDRTIFEMICDKISIYKTSKYRLTWCISHTHVPRDTPVSSRWSGEIG